MNECVNVFVFYYSLSSIFFYSLIKLNIKKEYETKPFTHSHIHTLIMEQTFFQIASTLVLPQWLLMIFLPKWKGTKWLRDHPVIPIALAVMYAGFVLIDIGSFNPNSFSTLAAVKELFASDKALLAGWIHYLAFDLLIGSYISKDAIERGIHPLLIAPCLFFTFMFGPVGWLLYQIIKLFKK